MSSDYLGGLAGDIADQWRDWTPTNENINALPHPIRRFIMEIETRCDPAGEVRSRVLAEENARGLAAKIEDRDIELGKLDADLILVRAALEVAQKRAETLESNLKARRRMCREHADVRELHVRIIEVEKILSEHGIHRDGGIR